MRIEIALVAGIATGCVTDHKSDPAPIVQPRSCIADVTLDGATGTSQPTAIGPLTLDQNGATICLHLDATQNLGAAHFTAATEQHVGSTSPFEVVLQDDSFANLQDGWDVTLDSGETKTYSNLEWNAPVHVETDAMLWIHARAQASTTMVSVALFEPFD